ncbi:MULTISPECIES: aromatic acid exporter family protein [Helcococcus]|uniref:Aromatic acid exporter family protein n=1 Tax=Helcococcus bovis TaxID=3153252 RepID=A0ABW9F5D4_9FIRM
MERFKKFDLLLNLQIAIAFTLSILFSQFFNLQNAITAGVITLLSVQITKKQTVVIALKRVFGFFLMLALILIFFNFMGYNLYSFGIFVLVFAVLNSFFNISVGLAPNVVIAGHFYAKMSTDYSFILNEIAIYLIGLIMAIAVNLIIPMTKKEKNIERDQLDEYLKKLLLYTSNLLNQEYTINSSNIDKQIYEIYIDKQIKIIKKFIDDLEIKTLRKIENTLLNRDIYDLEYLQMRKNQVNILVKIYSESKRLDSNFEQTQVVSDFIDEIRNDFDEKNTVVGLITKAKLLISDFKNDELPKTRNEFENRAILYVIMKDLIEFLREKYIFKNRKL